MAETAATFVFGAQSFSADHRIITTLEGIETEEQLDDMRAAGVELSQGYLFGKAGADLRIRPRQCGHADRAGGVRRGRFPQAVASFKERPDRFRQLVSRHELPPSRRCPGNVFRHESPSVRLARKSSEGALTQQQELVAYGNAYVNIALSHISPDGADHLTSQSTAQDSNDPTPQNFITEFQDIDYQLHHTAGSVGAPLVESILQALQAYQGTPIPGATGSGSTST